MKLQPFEAVMAFSTTIQDLLTKISNDEISPFDALITLTENLSELMSRISLNPKQQGSKIYQYTCPLNNHSCT